jgi:hypothetical protein
VATVDPKHRTLICQKAQTAAHRGMDAALWQDWRATVASLRIPYDVAVGLLDRDAQRWYARFCFDHGLDDEAIAAYEMLLEGNSEGQWIFEGEAERYLNMVGQRRGPAAVVAAYARFAAIDPDSYPQLHRVIADAEATLGRIDAAVQRMRAVTARYHVDGQNHAALARHLLAGGHDDEAKSRFIAAAKRGVIAAPAGIERLGIKKADLSRIKDQYATPDLDELLIAFLRKPGRTLVPTAGDADAPHVYEGGALEPPACPGCGKTILLLATIDTATAAVQEPTLAPLARTLPLLPILHCDNCQLMFASPDFRIAEDGRRIEVYNHQALKRWNAIFNSVKVLTPRPAQLVAPTPPTSKVSYEAGDELDRQRNSFPQIGGAPRPINQPQRRFCPRCDAEQVFYAAVCETTSIVVNPDGYAYFFACPACRVISTMLDNS